MSQNEHHKRLHGLMYVTGSLAAISLVSSTLAGCAGESAQVTPAPTRTPVVPTMPPTSPPLPTPTPTPEFTPTPTPFPENVNPLTGELVADASLLARVPVAIKIDNYPPDQVWPQTGINSADLIFEHYNEGWFSSRFTAVFLGKDLDKVGTVRSGRIIDLEIPAMYKAVFACSGFSNGVIELMRNSDLYPNQIVSESLPQTLHPSPFYRDETRTAPFNMYTSPARVRAWAEAHGVSGRQDIRGMVFSQEPPPGGTPATYVQVPWHLLNAEWTYDEASGRYFRWSDGTPHMDALDGSQLNVANVVVLYVAQWETDIVEDPHWGSLSIRWALWSFENPYRPAILFRDGLRYDTTWHRPARENLVTLTNVDGSPLPLKAGNTLFEVVPAGEERGFEIIVQ